MASLSSLPVSHLNSHRYTSPENISEVVNQLGLVSISYPALVADHDRLWQNLHHSAQWGAIPASQGMARLALSAEDKSVRDYFVEEARKIGCHVKVDQVGNIFAILPGQDNNIPPIGIGSHLDTQPAGKSLCSAI